MVGRLQRVKSRQGPFKRFELNDEVLILRGSLTSLWAVSSAVQKRSSSVVGVMLIDDRDSFAS